MDRNPNSHQGHDEFDPGELKMPESKASSNPTKQKKYKSKISWTNAAKKTAAAAFVAALLIAGGIFVYKQLSSKDSTDNSVSTNNAQDSEQNESEISAQALDQSFSSSSLRLDLMHPADWNIDENGRTVIITSPEFSYTDIDGQELNGFFKLYITKGATDSDGKYLGDGYAIKASEKIDYSQPESGQLESTYLSAFGLKKPDNFAYFVVQGNFDLSQGDTLGPRYANEVDAYLIAGMYSDSSIKDHMGSNPLSIENYDKTSQYLTAVDIVKSLKLR